MSSFISRGFTGRRRQAGSADRTPPGQYLTDDFPVLSAGPSPRTVLDTWDLQISESGASIARWSWEALMALPREEITKDIHCVTKWSKLDTVWEGVSIDTLLADIDTDAGYLIAHCDGGYTTNLPIEDVTNGTAWIAFGYDGEPLKPEHGGPASCATPLFLEECQMDPATGTCR